MGNRTNELTPPGTEHLPESLRSRHEDEEEEDYDDDFDVQSSSSEQSITVVKCIVAVILFSTAFMTYLHPSTMSLGALLSGRSLTSTMTTTTLASSSSSSSSSISGLHHHHGRRLTAMGDTIPSYIEPLLTDLKGRKKLFEDTPPEEIKYWFEYTGPLQVS